MGNSIPVYLVGEGPTEVGRGEYLHDGAGHEGFLEIVLRKSLDRLELEEAEINVVGRKYWKDLHLHGRDRVGEVAPSVVARKLGRAAALARQSGARALLFLLDDKGSKLTIDLRVGVPGVRGRFPAMGIAAGTAVQELEVVLIADGTACERALPDIDVDDRRRPEDVGNPKEVFKSAFAKLVRDSPANLERGLTWQEARYRVFEELNLETLEKRCPKGIGIFLKELDSVVAALGEAS